MEDGVQSVTMDLIRQMPMWFVNNLATIEFTDMEM